MGNRIIWFALLMGPIIFMMLVLAGVVTKPANVQPQSILIWINLTMLLIVPITYVVRRVIFSKGTIGGRITTMAYVSGNIIFWASCEGVAFFGIVVMMLNASMWPTLIFTVVALAGQALTFPMIMPVELVQQNPQ